jgi:cytoskeletal protein RodZ
MSQSTERAGSQPDDTNVTPFRNLNTDTVPRRIGDQLMSARLAKGIEIEDVAHQLRIRREFLQALEDGRFDALPGATYVAGFLRSYANYLRLDGEEMVRMYKDESGGVLVRQNLYFPIPASEARRPTGTMIIGALLVAVIAVALWYVVSERQFVDLDLVPPVPEFLDQSADEDRAVLAAQEAGEQAGGTDVASLFTDEPTAADGGIDAADGEAIPAEPIMEEAATAAEPETSVADVSSEDAGTAALAGDTAVETAPPATVPEPGEDVGEGDSVSQDGDLEIAATTGEADYVPRVYGRTNADARIEIRAIDTSWVQIEAPGNQVLLTRVLLPGDVYRVPNGDGITLKTGNAGGLELRVDGQLIDPLGEPGMVVKNVPLDPTALLQQ